MVFLFLSINTIFGGRCAIFRSFDFVGHPVLLSSTAIQLQCPAAQLNQLHIVEAERGSTPRRNSKRFQGKKKDVQAFEDLCAAYVTTSPHPLSFW